MAQRTPPSNSAAGGGSPSGGAGRQRRKPVQVQKSFPWGFVAGSAVLGLALLAILGFAIRNQGSGFVDKEEVGNAIAGIKLASAEEREQRDHVGGAIAYDTNPPSFGKHSIVWQNCGVYDAQVPSENALHSLEHGAVWITYRPGLAADQVDDLRKKAGQSHMLLSQLPGQSSPIVLSAWGRQLAVDNAGDERIDTFIDAFRQGPQTPEPGAACSGGSSSTGAVPVGPAPAPGGPVGSAAPAAPSGAPATQAPSGAPATRVPSAAPATPSPAR